MVSIIVLVLSFMSQSPAGAPAPPPVPAPRAVHDTLSGQYNGIKGSLLRLAQAMPEEHYGFTPAAGMRTFADSVNHVSEMNFRMCATLLSKPSPVDPQSLAGIKTKTEVIKALKDSYVFCDIFAARVTSEDFVAPYDSVAQMPDGKRTPIQVQRGGLLSYLIAHNNEMYGYLAVHLRLKDIVPPTSLPRTPPTGPGK